MAANKIMCGMNQISLIQQAVYNIPGSRRSKMDEKERRGREQDRRRKRERKKASRMLILSNFGEIYWAYNLSKI